MRSATTIMSNRKATMEAIDQAILSLPEQQRLAVILRRYDEFSYEEIG